jgi:PhnB protein
MLIGNSHIMLSDDGDVPGMPNFKSPAAAGKTTVGMCLYVEDVDALAKQAEAAGAKVLRAVETQFYGDRTGTFEDPFGHIWTIATHVEDVSHEELERRAREAH